MTPPDVRLASLAALLAASAFALPPAYGPTLSPDSDFTPNCTVAPCDGPLAPFYCRGKVLSLAWQLLGSGKACTGTGLKVDWEAAKRAAEKLPEKPSRAEFAAFCAEQFTQEPYLERANLSDWVESPKDIDALTDPLLKDYALGLHHLWPALGRSFRPEVAAQKDAYPVVAVPRPFVVPGGHFDIYFYWDSYWILKGLHVSGMRETARGILLNFADVIHGLGYIPNGGSFVLSKRSQPPYFPAMVRDFDLRYRDDELLSTLLPALDAEAEWWLRERSVKVRDSQGDLHRAFRYAAAMDCPRPEAYAQDVADALASARDHNEVWSDIASGAESGWDFSSRWFAFSGPHKGTKPSIMTSKILPVDLNTRMAENFRILKDLHRRLGSQDSVVRRNAQLEEESLASLAAVLWNSEAGVWLDAEVLPDDSVRPRQAFFPSNFDPLLLGGHQEDTLDRVAAYAKASGALDYPGGVPSSLDKASGQQWDFPNVWAPLVHNLVQGFTKTAHPKLQELGQQLAQRFVASTRKGFEKSGRQFLWEKYDAQSGEGQPGSGGEYKVEKGFGWSNGAVLDLIATLGREGQLSLGDGAPNASEGSSATLLVVLSLLLVLLVLIGFVYGARRGRCRRETGAEERGAYRTIAMANRVLYSESDDDDDDDDWR